MRVSCVYFCEQIKNDFSDLIVFPERIDRAELTQALKKMRIRKLLVRLSREMDLRKVAVLGGIAITNSLLRKVSDARKAKEVGLRILKGKLLLVHGTSDVNATFSATMKIVDALMQAGKPYDLIVFSKNTHGLTGRAREYWLDAAR